MKKVILFAAMILSADPIIDPVHAADREPTPTYCNSTGINDGGYVLTVSSDLKTAELALQTIMGPRDKTPLVCRPLPGNNFPDAINHYLVCSERGDETKPGTIVRMFSGGIAGTHYASVREVTEMKEGVLETELEYGNLSCEK